MQNLKAELVPASAAIENQPSRLLSEQQRQQLFKKMRQRLQLANSVISSGYAELDAQLGGGWPQGCLIEILGGDWLQPVIPLLAGLCQQQKTIAWVQPPYTPYPPSLQQQGISAGQQILLQPEKAADAFWSMEQLLRTAQCGAVLCWQEPQQPNSLRRLQLAAEAGNSFALLYRSASAQRQTSTAAVRLLVQRRNGVLMGKLLKARGGSPGQAFSLAKVSANG